VEIVLRAVVVYVLLWLLLRAMGKRELSEVTAFELVILVVLGDLVQNGVTQEDMSVTGSTLAVTTMGLLAVSSSVIGNRFRRTRPFLDGEPSIVVRDGEVQDEVLRMQRITRDELDEAARKKGISDLRRVRWGLVEADGAFSFVLADPDDEGAADDG
jgi:uncharacterized membrane protein YcaP (DUF421 family)